MQASRPSLFFRHDTLLGVCEGLRQDVGFNANYLRLALAVGLLFSPVATVVGYIAMGVLIALSRWIFPPRTDEAPRAATEPVAALRGDNDERVIELANAA